MSSYNGPDPFAPQPPHDGPRPQPSTRTTTTNDESLEPGRRPSRSYRNRKPEVQVGVSTSYDVSGKPISSNSESGRRPLDLLSPGSSNRQQPLVGKPQERMRSSRYPVYYPSDKSERYITPASSLVSSRQKGTDPASGRKRDSKYRKDRDGRGYIVPARSDGQRGYSVTSREIGSPIDLYESFSYTTPKEQFFRDSDAIREFRSKARSRRTRPLSLSGLEVLPPSLGRREGDRTNGPPPTLRGIDRVEPDGDYHWRDEGVQQYHSHRAPVSLHQGGGSESTSPYREYYNGSTEKKGYRIRRDEDDTVIVDEEEAYGSEVDNLPLIMPSRSSKRDRRYSDNSYISGISSSGGLATAGLASGYSHELREENSYNINPSHGRARQSKQYGSDSEFESDAQRGSHSNEIYTGKDRPEANISARRDRSQNGGSGGDDTGANRQPPSDGRITTLLSRISLDSERDNTITESPIEEMGSKELPKKYPSLETQQQQQPRPPPKGILKQPTEKFPEDKNTVREGVAPFKDAPKKGVPPGARWTKINRLKVSPAALEGRERFEVRPDCVIVLRALTAEEVEAYGILTAEIRAARRYSSRRSYERRYIDDGRRSRRRELHNDYDSEDEDRKKPLSIEAPPSDTRRR